MLKIAVVGAGSHSRTQHLPALRHYAAEHPGEITLAGLCDLDGDLAARTAEAYGFVQSYTDLGEMLAEARPDACVAVTPIAVTAAVARQVIEAGVPLLMEKPPGASPAEGQAVADLAEEKGVPVMVSVNRRFDPAVRMVTHWWGDVSPDVVRGCMCRVARQEPDFMTGTGIHALDTLRHLAGDVETWRVRSRRVHGITWFVVDLTFVNGTIGVLEVLPSAGHDVEVYELSGNHRRARVRTGYKDRGDLCCWAEGEVVLEGHPADGQPAFVRSGAYAETAAFIDALPEGRPPVPTIADVLPSLTLCHAILDAAKEEACA
jgi:predicted dehydrogenase